MVLQVSVRKLVRTLLLATGPFLFLGNSGWLLPKSFDRLYCESIDRLHCVRFDRLYCVYKSNSGVKKNLSLFAGLYYIFQDGQG